MLFTHGAPLALVSRALELRYEDSLPDKENLQFSRWLFNYKASKEYE